MNQRIKKIDGALLAAILRGAIVFQHKATRQRAYVVIEQLPGVKGNEKVFKGHNYAMFESFDGGPFMPFGLYSLEPQQTYREINDIWAKAIRKEHAK